MRVGMYSKLGFLRLYLMSRLRPGRKTVNYALLKTSDLYLLQSILTYLLCSHVTSCAVIRMLVRIEQDS